jgi:hypothetical protein
MVDASDGKLQLETVGITVYYGCFRNSHPLWEAVLKRPNLAIAFIIGFSLLSPFHSFAEKTAGNSAGANVNMPGNEGKVIATLDAPGYTYMELANTEKRFWIAAPTTRVKVGDRVRFDQSLVMKNFNSKTLNRTFDQIIFVNSANVIN